MRIPKNVKCETCSKVFCCAKCRINHEINIHMAKDKLFSCDICCGLPFTLDTSRQHQLMDHIAKQHLPLKCDKCSETFKEMSDLKNVTKCKRPNELCELQLPVLKETKENANPDDHRKESFTNDKQQNEKSITDSISSIRNVSSIANMSSDIMHKTASPNRNLVRQTSTPMHLLHNEKQSSFNSINQSCQMSSINTSNSDSDVSPPMQVNNESPSKTHKIIRCRNKMPISATPLRQVMSKSIQKALVEHGIPTSKKSIFSPTTSLTPPLDLRTSAALQRTQSSEFSSSRGSYSRCNKYTNTKNHMQKFHSNEDSNKIVQTNLKSINMSDQSLFILPNSLKSVHSSKQHLDTVYETCQSIEIHSQNNEPNDLYQTPKTTGVLKKTGSFAERNLSAETPVNSKEDEDVWYTPPTSSNSKAEIIENELNCNVEDIESSDEIIKTQPNPEEHPKQNGKFWTIFSSMIRFASFGSSKKGVKSVKKQNFKKCASFTNVESDTQVQSTYKRRRTLSIDVPINSLDSVGEYRITKKIKGRLPINRMRKESK